MAYLKLIEMKHLFLTFLVLLSFCSCTDTNGDVINNENINYTNSNNQTQDLNRGFLCPTGYHLEFQVFDELVLFKKSKCDDGFGFCFGIRVNIVFDCVRNPIIEPALSKLSYNNITGETKAIGIQDPSSKTITFYFHEDIVNSPNHNSSDFDTFDVETGVSMNDDIELVGGSYPVIKTSGFFKYIVPYVYKN